MEWPDIQYHFLPAAIRYDGKSAFDGDGFQVHVGHNKPKSRGSVTLQSANPTVPPKILFNYLQHPDDIEGFRACVRLTREIIAQSAFDDFRDGEIQPGEHIQTDEEIDAFVREAVESAYHPSCSCKMGEDEMAVVDSQTNVHGIEGASGGFFYLPHNSKRKPKCANHHGGGKGCRHHSGKPALPPQNVPVDIPPALANKATLNVKTISH